MQPSRMRDTPRPVLFSGADAIEKPAYNFRMRDVCAAMCAGSDRSSAMVEVLSCDGSTRIVVVSIGVVLEDENH